MQMLIQNGHVVDPATGIDGIRDILITDGKIEAIEEKIQMTSAEVIDAEGMLVMPGLIDLHVHLRDPGLTDKETLETGTKSAAKGGFTTVCAMPNTSPIMDTKEKLEAFTSRFEEEASVRVIQFGAMTMGELGEKEADLSGMKEAGCIGISEDGKSVMDAALLEQIMLHAKELGLGIYDHCEDKELVQGGVINLEGAARRLGLPGISNEVEDSITRRDIALAKKTGAKLHICHISTAGALEAVRQAKEEGLPVTAEVCPHHLTLSCEDITEDDANYKMNPPLRSVHDVNALKRGLKDGIIDAIATDHAPHTEEEKSKGFLGSPFGIIGLETAVPLIITELVEPGILTYMQMADRMSATPAKILGIDAGSLAPGKDADLVVIDPNFDYVIRKDDIVSKGKNTPFIGKKVRGKVRFTICGGKIVYQFH